MPPTNSKRSDSDQAALAELSDRGAHLVLCEGKRPVWKRWQKVGADKDLVLAHAGNVGVIPASLGTSALDVDFGEIGELVEAHAPLVTVGSPRGHHLYYGDREARGNGKFEAFGCKGEVRSAKGYLVMWPGAPARLSGALRSRDPREAPFPTDLFQAAGVPMPETARVVPFDRDAASIALEAVYPGARNVALFDVVRLWAYKQRRDEELGDWLDRVHAFTRSQNDRFPDPLPVEECRSVAYSVGCWTWSRNARGYDHSPEVQAERGKRSGMVRRRINAARDAAICAAAEGGRSFRQIAAEHGLSNVAVRKIIARDAPLITAGRRADEASGIVEAADLDGYLLASLAGGQTYRMVAEGYRVSVARVQRAVRRAGGSVSGVNRT